MTYRLRHAASAAIGLGIVYAVACALGFGLLVLAFKVGVLAQFDILFYRGLVLVVLAFVTTFGLLALAVVRWRPRALGVRDAFAAAVLSLSFNTCFLVVVPVTVDRSISIFMLAQMADRPNETFTPDSMSALFTRIYIRDDRQIDRRLHEQAISGNFAATGDGYRISARGRMVIVAARFVATLFDSHAGLVAPRDVKAAALQPRTGP